MFCYKQLVHSSIRSNKLFLVTKRKGIKMCLLVSSLGHGERQVVGSHLDLVLGLQVSHPVGADAVDGHDDVALDQVTQRRLAARSDLSGHGDV